MFLFVCSFIENVSFEGQVSRVWDKNELGPKLSKWIKICLNFFIFFFISSFSNSNEFFYSNYSMIFFFTSNFSRLTLECGISMPARLLIFKLFSRQHALISHSVCIHSNIFDQKYWKFMFFRLQYVHFWALILVSIKFSRRHVYYFHKLFQQACLFRQAHLFRTLEHVF